MNTIINCTPHPLRVLIEGTTEYRTIPSSGIVTRFEVTSEIVGSVDGVPIRKTQVGEVTGLPAPREGVIYVTSTLVAQAAGRADVVSPDTGPSAIRENGQVVAVKGFQSFF